MPFLELFSTDPAAAPKAASQGVVPAAPKVMEGTKRPVNK